MQGEEEHILRRPEMLGVDRYQDAEENERPCKCTREDCCGAIGSCMVSISVAGIVSTIIYTANLGVNITAALLIGLTITATVGCYLSLIIGCVGRGRRAVEPTGVTRAEVAPGQNPPRVRRRGSAAGRRHSTLAQNDPRPLQAHIDPEEQGPSGLHQPGDARSDDSRSYLGPNEEASGSKSPSAEGQNVPLTLATSRMSQAAASIALIAAESVSRTTRDVAAINESGGDHQASADSTSSEENRSIRRTSPSDLRTASSDRDEEC